MILLLIISVLEFILSNAHFCLPYEKVNYSKFETI